MLYFSDSGRGLDVPGTLDGGAVVEGFHVPQFLCFAFPCIVFWFA